MLRNHQFPLLLLWAKEITLPLKVMGARVDVEAEVKVKCLLLTTCLYGGISNETLSISSSRGVFFGSETSTSFCYPSTTISLRLKQIDILLQPLRCIFHDRPLSI